MLEKLKFSIKELRTGLRVSRNYEKTFIQDIQTVVACFVPIAVV